MIREEIFVNIVNIQVKIKAIDAMLPNDDYILRRERQSKKGKVSEGDYMESTIKKRLE